jgi:hypothetical protein
MTSPILRILGAIAGFGSAVLCWFLGNTLAPQFKARKFFSMGTSNWALFAFLLVPALILAVVALFWVPPRVSGEGPLPEGRRWRLALILFFVAAFTFGLAGEHFGF